MINRMTEITASSMHGEVTGVLAQKVKKKKKEEEED